MKRTLVQLLLIGSRHLNSEPLALPWKLSRLFCATARLTIDLGSAKHGIVWLILGLPLPKLSQSHMVVSIESFEGASYSYESQSFVWVP